MTDMTPQKVAKFLGIGVYELARHLREEAARALTSLASDIERGAESIDGDVDARDYLDRTTKVWRLVESAQACDAVWQKEHVEVEA